MVLDLQSGDGVASVSLHVVEGLGAEVGNADGAGNARVDGGLESFPSLTDGNLGGGDGALVIHPPGLYLSMNAIALLMKATHRVSPLLRINVLKRHGEVNQVQINVSQPPSLVLRLGHSIGMLALVVVVPELGGDEDVLALNETFGDGTLDALSRLLFVLVVVGSVEAAISSLDSLEVLSDLARLEALGRTNVVDCISSLVGRNLPEAEAHEGHLVARGKLDGGLNHCEVYLVGASLSNEESRRSVGARTQAAGLFITLSSPHPPPRFHINIVSRFDIVMFQRVKVSQKGKS